MSKKAAGYLNPPRSWCLAENAVASLAAGQIRSKIHASGLSGNLSKAVNEGWSIAGMKQLFMSKDERVVRVVTDAATECGPLLRPLLNDLVFLLGHPDAIVRQNFLYAILGCASTYEAPVVYKALDSLEDNDATVRYFAFLLFIKIETAVLEEIYKSYSADCADKSVHAKRLAQASIEGKVCDIALILNSSGSEFERSFEILALSRAILANKSPPLKESDLQRLAEAIDAPLWRAVLDTLFR